MPEHKSGAIDPYTRQSIARLAGLPDVEKVVVAARRELPAGGAPLEAAHLLLVAHQTLLHVVPLPGHAPTASRRREKG